MPRLESAVVDRFEELVSDPETDMVEYLWPHVHPDMAARERARKAVLLTLASNMDRQGKRGRCHTLLVGPPGTGKTEILGWVNRTVGGAIRIGPDSSGPGLKGDARGEAIEPGALNMAHSGILLVEELDKFDKSERDSLYEALSEGEYSIHKGGKHVDMKAEVRAIAACNSTDGFKPALLNRFDFVLELDEYDADETDEVTEKLYENWWETFIEGGADAREPLLPSYLKWIETFEPAGDRESLHRIQKMRTHLIHDGGFHGDVRTKESYLRVSHVISKLNRRDVTPYDYLRAIQLLHPDEVNGSITHALKTIADGEDIHG